ncbi:MAG: hypothetical protein NC078_04545 [Ruminococcus sp.]|nr:hypothetical protein [Ruminococcus sp.]
MKKNVLAAAVMMVVMGGCGSVSGDGMGSADWGGEIMGSEEVVSLAESMASSMAESMVESMLDEAGESVSVTEVTRVTRAVTEEPVAETDESGFARGVYYRKSEEESKTVTIDSEVYPYDCEEIQISVSTYLSYGYAEPYDCIDLRNLEKYPNLKRLIIEDINAQGSPCVKLINGDCTAKLENLEEISLRKVVWDYDWLSGISTLKKLTVDSCYDYNGEYLENMPQVEYLELTRCAVTDLSFVNGMSALTQLNLIQTKLSNSSFDGVEENHSVKQLTLIDNSNYILHDEAVEYLLTSIAGVSKFKGLESLHISEMHLVDEEKQMKDLQEELPACEINK